MKDAKNKDTTPAVAGNLGEYIKHARLARKISIRELAKAVGMNHSYVGRLEMNQLQQPAPEKLEQIAHFLELDYSDLCALVGYRAPNQLPSFVPYLRARYKMTDGTAQELGEYFDKLRREHRVIDKSTLPESAKWEDL